MELWPKWHFNRFSILATVLHVHSEVNWILFGCFPLHVVALIRDAVCALAIIANTALRTIRVLHYARKQEPCPEDHEVEAGGPFPYMSLFTLPQRKIIQRCKARQSCRHSIMCPSPITSFRNYSCSQLRITTVLWQVAPFWRTILCEWHHCVGVQSAM